MINESSIPQLYVKWEQINFLIKLTSPTLRGLGMSQAHKRDGTPCGMHCLQLSGDFLCWRIVTRKRFLRHVLIAATRQLIHLVGIKFISNGPGLVTSTYHITYTCDSWRAFRHVNMVSWWLRMRLTYVWWYWSTCVSSTVLSIVVAPVGFH